MDLTLACIERWIEKHGWLRGSAPRFMEGDAISREAGGGRVEGMRPRPGLPPEPTGPLRRERSTRLPWRPGPLLWADDGVLGPGGRPSCSVFNEPVDGMKTPPRPSPASQEREPRPVRWWMDIATSFIPCQRVLTSRRLCSICNYRGFWFGGCLSPPMSLQSA